MSARTTRHWSDWIGVLAFTVLGVNLWRQAPEFGLLVLPALLQELIVAISFLLRGRPRQVAAGWMPRVIAYAHTFVIMVFLLYAAAERPEWVAATPAPELRQAGALLWIAGAMLSLWPLWYLRRSFSVEPAARALVTTGPYRFARHPIYTVYVLINIGILLGHLTVPLALVIGVWLVLLIFRIRNEEAVLARAFPEYDAYRRRIGAFGPRRRPSKLGTGLRGERAR